MRLLLSNDDGINAKGIYELAKALAKEHEVIIVAPDTQRSACGHSITIGKPLIVKKVKLKDLDCKAYSVSGTPADCVKIGLNKLVDGKVDMVISGINYGFNLGTDVIYSGTVSAAVEASICDVPSIAFSVKITKDIEEYSVAAKYALSIVRMAATMKLKSDVVLNVNVPLLKEDEIKGIKVCKIGNRRYNNYYKEVVDDDNNLSIEFKGEIDPHVEEDTDIYYFKEGYVTVTPLHYDLTNFKIIKEVESWF